MESHPDYRTLRALVLNLHPGSVMQPMTPIEGKRIAGTKKTYSILCWLRTGGATEIRSWSGRCPDSTIAAARRDFPTCAA